jgi:four helix bundle protein
MKTGFKELIVWQKAYGLTLEVYKLSKNFPKEETYRLVSQLQRAVVSIPANIAEGYERNHKKEYIHFLYIAKGSLGEAETYLLLARDLDYIFVEQYRVIEDRRGEVARLLRGLIKSLT